MTEEDAFNLVGNAIEVVYKAVPGETFLEGILGVAIDGDVASNVIESIINLWKSGNLGSSVVEGIKSYDEFWRDMSVATCAAFVLYAVENLKSRIGVKGIGAKLGFYLASIFWVLAGYTFGEVITSALEKRVDESRWMILYIIIVVVAVVLEAAVHAFGEKCAVWKLIVLFCLKQLTNIVRTVFAALMCTCFVGIFTISTESAEALMNPLSNVVGMIISAGLVVSISALDSRLKKLLS